MGVYSKAEPIAVGTVFGRLTVMDKTASRNSRSYALVQCQCGVVKEVMQKPLRSGRLRSCGCLGTDSRIATKQTHGRSKEPIYFVWKAMVQRCTNPNDAGFPNYGGRGITIDSAWLQFETFYADMGDPPFVGASIDREDNSKGYSKANCRWATDKEQSRNRRSNIWHTYQGRSLILPDWAELVGLPYATLSNRLHKGWSLERTLTTPLNGIQPNPVELYQPGLQENSNEQPTP